MGFGRQMQKWLASHDELLKVYYEHYVHWQFNFFPPSHHLIHTVISHKMPSVQAPAKLAQMFMLQARTVVDRINPTLNF